MEKRHRQHLPDGSHFDLILIEAGHFMMGSKGYSSEQPIHKVQLADFYLAQYPVTQALWLAVVGGENPASFQGLQRPIENVSWYDAAAFCNRLNELCGYVPVYYSDAAFTQPLDLETSKNVDHPNTIDIFAKSEKIGYRLPSEAQWEYAARGGKGSDKRPTYQYAGGDKLDEVGWYGENSHGETKPVGLKMGNELELHDLSGNLEEWCEDSWHRYYQGAPQDGSAWVDEKGVRVKRGGSWYHPPRFCRSSSRIGRAPDSRDFIGFRVVLYSPPGSWSVPSQ